MAVAFTEADIIKVLIERLEKMTKVSDKERVRIAKDLEEFCSTEAVEYSPNFYGMSEDLQEIIRGFAQLRSLPEGAYLQGNNVFDLQEVIFE